MSVSTQVPVVLPSVIKSLKLIIELFPLLLLLQTIPMSIMEAVIGAWTITVTSVKSSGQLTALTVYLKV